MLPSAFVPIAAIPLNRNGKLDPNALPRDVDDPIERTYEAPRDPVELALQQIFEDVLGIHLVGLRESFFDLGGDSLGAMRLVNSLNAQFKVNLPMRSLFEYPTIDELAVAVRLNCGGNPGGRLVPLQPGGSKQKLFCIHPAGGHVFCYLPLVRELGLDQPVFGLQARGLEEGESLAHSIEEMASEYIEAIRVVQPDGPYQLLGMSSGGLIAYQMARQIKQGGGEVHFLALLDTTVPGSTAETIFSGERLLRAMAIELGCEDLLNDAPPALTLAELVDMARRAGRLPSDFSLVQAKRIAEVFRNTVRMHFSYRPGNWDGPLLLLRALRRLRDSDSLPDWSPYAGRRLEVVDLDCGHSDLVSPTLAPAVASLLARSLSQNSERKQ
jgi:thioesterase domain-containing protein/acyl carrier protein